MNRRKRYDPQADSAGSYAAAVEAKRLRGDTHWPARQERPTDPETERQMKQLKRALDRKLKHAEEPAEGRKGDRPSRPMARPARSVGAKPRQREGNKDA